MDHNKYVLKWDLERNGIKLDLEKNIYPSTPEANAIAEAEANYTAFRNMLRFTTALPDFNTHGANEAVNWDPDMEYITTK